MEKAEHGRRLAAAMRAKGLKREVLADLTGKGVRTITNWTSGANMPTEQDRTQLRALLGDYDADGDLVQTAIRGCRLIKWRQDAVLSEYERHLYEQGREAAG